MLTIGFGDAGGVAHETAGQGVITTRIDGRDGIARRQAHELFGPGSKEWSSVDEQRADVSLRQRHKRVVKFALAAGVHDMQREPKRARHRFQLFGYAVGCLGPIGEQANDVGRHQITQKAKSFQRRGLGEEGYTGDVAARPVDARDKASGNRIQAGVKYDRNR